MRWSVKATLLVLCLFQNCPVSASDKSLGPGILAVGAFELIPLVKLQESYKDNIFFSPDGTRKASFITQVSAGGQLNLRRKLDRYAFRYTFLSSTYHSSPADDYIDHALEATAHFEITQRNRLNLSSSYRRDHNMRGTFLSQGALATKITSPDEYHAYMARLDYQYGRPDAIGILDLQLGFDQLVYDNHRERTAALDQTRYSITPGFYLRIMKKTYATLQMDNNWALYDNKQAVIPQELDAASLGNDYLTNRYLVGIRWDQSAQNKAMFRIGYLTQQYLNSNLPASSGITWDGELTWSPVDYSVFTVGVSRNTQPSIGIGSSRNVQFYKLGWEHKWPGNRTLTHVQGSYQQVSGQGNGNSASGVAFQVDLKHALKSWLDVGVGYSYSDLQYDLTDFNSVQNIFMLYLNVTPKATGS